ncbi:MAG: IS4 family transposase [Verrucomicrobiota bacterium]
MTGKTQKADISDWVRQEMAGVDCGDVRLNMRLGKLISALAAVPGASIPSACDGAHADIAAAYRFFDNEALSPQCLLAPHVERTRHRTAQHDTVLLVQDTTEVDMSQPQRRIHGAGPLDDSPRQGVLLHLMHAFTLQGGSLGSVWHRVLVREPRGAGTKRKSRSQRQSMPIEQKESWRWIQGAEAARELAVQQPGTRHICIADSEADIYEYLTSHVTQTGGQAGTEHASPQPGSNLHCIVRACQDRALLPDKKKKPESVVEPGVQTLWEDCRKSPARWRKELHVRGRNAKLACDKRSRRQPREDRKIQVEVRAVEQLSLRAPQRSGGRLPSISINAVLVSEMNPPPGDTAVEWLLLTTLPVRTQAQMAEVVEAYSQRFSIEVFFRTLKSGCGIEERRFHDARRHLNHIALALVIAWRVCSLSHLGREAPQTDASEHFSPEEWQSAWAAIKREQPPATCAPTMGEMMKLVGKLGGWIERGGKSASPPGVQTLWKGLQRLHDLSLSWSLLSTLHTCV